MIKVIRAQSPVLLAILFVLISLSFIVFYNIPQLEQLRGGSLGKIDGREIGVEEFRIAQQSALFSVLMSSGQDLSTNGRGEILNQLAWQRLLFLAEAKKLQSIATEDQIVAFIRNLPFLQKSGQFDPAIYNRFTKDFLPSRGLNTARFEQIIKEEILIRELRETLMSPVQIPPFEVDQMLNTLFGSTKISLVRLKNTDFLQEVKIDETQVEKEYKTQSANPAYRTPESRKVAFISLNLSADQQKLKDPEKAAAKRALGEKAMDFAVALLEKNEGKSELLSIDSMMALAKERGYEVKTTDFFTLSEAPKELPPSPAFNRAAFGLHSDLPLSDAIETDSGFVVIKLLEIHPSELRPLDQIRPVLEANLRLQTAVEITQKRGEELSVLLKTQLGSHKPLPEAAKELKVTLESPAAFVPMEAPPTLKEADEIVNALRGLNPGQPSHFIPTSEGGLVIILESRGQPDKTSSEKMRPRVASQLLSERRTQVMEEWLRSREHAAGTVPPGFLVRN